jgi:type II secretory pathway component PulM
MRPALRKTLAYGGAALVLLAVFALYTQPAMLVTLSDMVWACFN